MNTGTISATKYCKVCVRCAKTICARTICLLALVVKNSSSHYPPQNWEKAERLRENVGKTPVMTKYGEISVTINIGVSTFSLHNQVPIESLLVQADKAIYFAKNAGRNRVVLWDEHKPQTT